MQGMHFCLVDEADSILIDEARTPLIIGSIEDTVRDQIVETYRWASKHARRTTNSTSILKSTTIPSSTN